MKTPTLKSLHTSLHEQANQVLPRTSGMPIVPARKSAPLTAQNKWEVNDVNGVKWLMKEYSFVDNITRNRFISDLLSFEEQTGFGAELMAIDCKVHLRLTNLSANVPLDEDREYTLIADDIYRDVTFEAFIP